VAGRGLIDGVQLGLERVPVEVFVFWQVVVVVDICEFVRDCKAEVASERFLCDGSETAGELFCQTEHYLFIL